MAKWREIPIRDVKSVTLESGDTMSADDFFAACHAPVVSNAPDLEARIADQFPFTQMAYVVRDGVGRFETTVGKDGKSEPIT